MVIKESLQLLVDIWYNRNDQYHNKEEGEDISPETQQIHKRVKETYEDRLAYTPTIQTLLFDRTIEERLQQRPFQLVKWIQTVDMTSRTLDNRQEPVYAYFNPTRPPDGDTYDEIL